MTIFDIDPTFPPQKWVEHRRKLAEERVRIIQTRHRRKDGTTFPIEVAANYIKKDGLGFSYSFVTDISGRVEADRNREQLEAQLRHAQKMEAIGALAGGIAHDFNNILSVVIGNADILQFSGDLAEADRPCLQQILIATSRAKQLVQQILTFSRRGDRSGAFGCSRHSQIPRWLHQGSKCPRKRDELSCVFPGRIRRQATRGGTGGQQAHQRLGDDSASGR